MENKGIFYSLEETSEMKRNRVFDGYFLGYLHSSWKKTWSFLLLLCLSVIMNACQAPPTSTQKTETIDQETKLLSAIYYRELADLVQKSRYTNKTC